MNEMRTEPLAKQRSRTFDSLSGAPGYRAGDIFSGSVSYIHVSCWPTRSSAKGFSSGSIVVVDRGISG